MEMWILVGKDVGLDVSEGGIRLVLDAVVEDLDDVFLKPLCVPNTSSELMMRRNRLSWWNDRAAHFS